jgi:hypothetical protein
MPGRFDRIRLFPGFQNGDALFEQVVGEIGKRRASLEL